ncbi:MAG: metallophosphoesterase [Gammaproteobacteria bacterium]|nr:metallophosphoesterase [Gammaproteobacteria bacterium]NNJ91120.1 metallophosphoesterase [Gammaproteobacteria bacterium]
MDSDWLENLEHRLGTHAYAKRMRRQTKRVAFKLSGKGTHVYWENIDPMYRVLQKSLRMMGLLKKAQQNTMDFRIEEIPVTLKRLPETFHHYRILHLSDLHIDFMHDEGERLIEHLQTLHFDLCVITGDYRFHTGGVSDGVIEGMKKLMPSLECKDGVIGILGNHDDLEIVPHLESLGIKVLLNESLAVQRDQAFIWIAGVEDPHYYQTDDIDKALHKVPAEETIILLAHSPEIIDEADEIGIDYYLCGHTHGGQVCLPGGMPIITNTRNKRRFSRGSWEYGDLKGYTSRGTGSSGLPIRVFCPPEITIHTLHVAQ